MSFKLKWHDTIVDLPVGKICCKSEICSTEPKKQRPVSASQGPFACQNNIKLYYRNKIKSLEKIIKHYLDLDNYIPQKLSNFITITQ